MNTKSNKEGQGLSPKPSTGDSTMELRPLLKLEKAADRKGKWAVLFVNKRGKLMCGHLSLHGWHSYLSSHTGISVEDIERVEKRYSKSKAAILARSFVPGSDKTATDICLMLGLSEKVRESCFFPKGEAISHKDGLIRYQQVAEAMYRIMDETICSLQAAYDSMKPKEIDHSYSYRFNQGDAEV